MVHPRGKTIVVAVVASVVLALAVTLVKPSTVGATSAACPDGEVPPSGFGDVAGNVHEQAIACVVWHGIAQGVSSSEYAPSRGVRRDQLAAFVARTIEAAEVDLGAATDQGFTDIAGNVHADAINRLAAHGVVRGTTATTFAPREVVRRDQMATFLVRAAELIRQEPLPDGPTEFTDIAGNVHERSITKVATNGLARGTSPTTYSPRNGVRRDQMASFLANTLGLLGVPPPDEAGVAYQVLPLYVVPRDGEDRGLATDGSIAGSVNNFNDWLAGETGGSRVRVAMVGGQVDVGFHRLERTESDLGQEGDFIRDALEEELRAAGFDKSHQLYAVYYDGVVEGDNRCGGSGPWPPEIVGNTVAVYVKDCTPDEGPGTPNTDLAMLHEIAHGIGMVPDTTVDGSPCAPNHTQAGHVSDSPQDLMYAGEEDWDIDNMRLDVNDDDYAYAPFRPGCPNLLHSAFLEPLPDPAVPPPGW